MMSMFNADAVDSGHILDCDSFLDKGRRGLMQWILEEVEEHQARLLRDKRLVSSWDTAPCMKLMRSFEASCPGPTAVAAYNKYFGGVDTSNLLLHRRIIK